MIIKKFLHSCLLVEENGKKLLIDPGAFSFIENKLKPSDFGRIDVVLLTHSHSDHFYPEALKIFSKEGATIVASQEIGNLLEKEGLKFEGIKEGEERQVAGFLIKALKSPHERLPVVLLPHNFAFLINNTLLHPGDSISFEPVKCKVFAMPVAGPWLKLLDAIAIAEKLKPEFVIPIHDAIIKDFMLERMYNLMCKPTLEKSGISFKPLQLGEQLEV